jgi:hypothetical protein
MNSFFKLFLVIGAIYGSYTWFNSDEGLKESDWVNYQFTLLNIKASFPLKPRVDNKKVQGTQVEFVTVNESKNHYSVGVVNGISFNSDDMYPFSLINKGAVIKSEKDIYINGYIGKEYQLVLNGKSVIQHFIKYKGSLINQLTIYKKTDITDKKVDFFFKSLVL